MTRHDSTAPTGLVVVDKPAGLTSHDVVAQVRRLAGTRKVGHAGTLDPMATGVLLLGLGRATRLLGHLMLTEKSYDAVVRLGQATTTDDAEGQPTHHASAAGITEEQVRAAFAGFVGDIEQVPSSVSAVKVDGRRAYARVRAGEDVELAGRPVRIHRIDVAGLVRHHGLLDVTVRVRCSTGTYVRALARDVGRALGVGGHLTALRRTGAGPFTLADAHTLDGLAEQLAVLPLDEVARRTFPSRTLAPDQAASVASGRRLEIDLGLPGPVALFGPDGDFLALYEQRGVLAAAVAVFTS